MLINKLTSISSPYTLHFTVFISQQYKHTTTFFFIYTLAIIYSPPYMIIYKKIHFSLKQKIITLQALTLHGIYNIRWLTQKHFQHPWYFPIRLLKIHFYNIFFKKYNQSSPHIRNNTHRIMNTNLRNDNKRFTNTKITKYTKWFKHLPLIKNMKIRVHGAIHYIFKQLMSFLTHLSL